MDGPAAYLKATRREIARVAVREGIIFINADTLRFWTRGTTPSRIYYSLVSRSKLDGGLVFNWFVRYFPRGTVIPQDVKNAMARLRESARIPVKVATGDISSSVAIYEIAEDLLWHDRYLVHEFITRLPFVPEGQMAKVDNRAICVGVLTTRL